MSRLEYYGRPLVAFDATNRTHRQYYANFVNTASWGTCPVRFIVPEDINGGDLISMIKNALINHYVTREFDRAAPKGQPGRKPTAKRS